jgi:hypothetical protein
MNYLHTCLAAIASVAVLSACDSSPPETAEVSGVGTPLAGPAPGASSIRDGLVDDKSVPDATASTGAQPSSGTSTAGAAGSGTAAANQPGGVPANSAKDDQSPDPLSNMSQPRETTQMPKALDGNNHSSPNVGTDAKPPTQ